MLLYTVTTKSRWEVAKYYHAINSKLRIQEFVHAIPFSDVFSMFTTDLIHFKCLC